MSRKARRDTGLRQLRVNGYSIRERRNTAGLRQLRVKSPSKAITAFRSTGTKTSVDLACTAGGLPNRRHIKDVFAATRQQTGVVFLPQARPYL
ncbi:MAG: hypothetical protein B7X29_04170 [Halothiobacillus sp. 13-55-115]|nr:MAG: hypothetical protein B7X29_04170 [Halothiobacillus sp. 13-55-115]